MQTHTFTTKRSIPFDEFEKCRLSQKLVSAQKWNPPSSSIIVFLLFLFILSQLNILYKKYPMESYVKRSQLLAIRTFSCYSTNLCSFWWNWNGERIELCICSNIKIKEIIVTTFRIKWILHNAAVYSHYSRPVL